MIMIYIASPYTIGDVAVNVRTQMIVADNLMNYGYCPIIPLLSHFQHMHKPRDYEEWLRIDFEKLLRSDAVIRLPGKSIGADREVVFAKENNIPVFFGFEDFFEHRGDVFERGFN